MTNEDEKSSAEVLSVAITSTLNYFMPTVGIPRKIARVIHRGGIDENSALKATRGAFGDILILGGSIGTGKSVAAAEWLKEFIANPKSYKQVNWRWGWYHEPPVFITAATLALWPIFNPAAIAVLTNTPRLVFDDLGCEAVYEKGAFLATVESILSARISEERKTVITTNLDADGLAKRYGARLVDRIWGCGTYVGCPGASLRGTKGRSESDPCSWDPTSPWWTSALKSDSD
jgi:hypothetical protein